MKKGDWYKIFLIFLFVAVWIWAAINPSDRSDWLAENYLVFFFVPLIILAGIYFKLSNLSYTFITIFMIVHVIGSHYTYSYVPFGFTLQSWFGSNRNMYDRLVHFSFGLLIAYPIREVFMRLAKAKGFWSYWFPIELALAFSCVYELIEWGGAAILSPGTGPAFIGAQGDVWDAQKDMAMAGLGSIVAMLITLFINIKLQKGFWKEFKDSFKVPKGDKPLGEEKLEEMIKSK